MFSPFFKLIMVIKKLNEKVSSRRVPKMKRFKHDKIVLNGLISVKDNYCGQLCLTRRQTH